MIKFFRNIRKSLLSENKTGKYLKYAIGEILLVVIGILIALQINNWNTNKQDIKVLNGYLNNIKKNMQADLVSLAEIKVIRDSSILYSQNYLELAKRDNINSREYNSIMNSDYVVFFDTYFKSKRSGFEGLKNSGFLGRINDTKLEKYLNEYYYLVEKIDAQEKSLFNTIETMENEAHNSNVWYRMIQIYQEQHKDEYFLKSRVEIKNLLNHPNIIAANYRNSNVTTLPKYYRQLEKLGQNIIAEIDLKIKTKG